MQIMSFFRSAALSLFFLGTSYAQLSGQYALILKDSPVSSRLTNREALRPVAAGIDQTHPALQDSTLSMPAGVPTCTDGHPEDRTNFTNSKVIVARSYIRQIAAGSSATNPAADSRPDDFSPRDHEGHGTAIA